MLCLHVIITAIALIIIYIYIGMAIFKQLKRISPTPVGNPQQQETSLSDLKNTMKAFKTFLLVVGIFVVSFVPVCFLLELKYLGLDVDDGYFQIIFKVANVLRIINSAANPIIYALRMTTFRKAMKRMLCCCIKSNEVAPLPPPD